MTERKLAIMHFPPQTKPRDEKERVHVRRRRKGAKRFPARFVDKEVQQGKKKKHVRTLAHGEIIERVRINIEILFTETIPHEERHHAYSVENIRQIIRPDVEPWVKRYGQDKRFRLMPSLVIRALETMTMRRKGMIFRLDSKDTVRLLNKGEEMTVHHELVPPKPY